MNTLEMSVCHDELAMPNRQRLKETFVHYLMPPPGGRGTKKKTNTLKTIRENDIGTLKQLNTIYAMSF